MIRGSTRWKWVQCQINDEATVQGQGLLATNFNSRHQPSSGVAGVSVSRKGAAFAEVSGDAEDADFEICTASALLKPAMSTSDVGVPPEAGVPRHLLARGAGAVKAGLRQFWNNLTLSEISGALSPPALLNRGHCRWALAR